LKRKAPSFAAKIVEMRRLGSHEHALRWLVLLASLVAALSLLTACGDDDDAGEPTAEPSPSAVPEPTPEGPSVDPCASRQSLEGDALVQGPSFALDGADYWQLCIGGAAAGSSEKLLFRSTDGGNEWTLISRTSLGDPPPEPGVGDTLPNGNAASVLLFVDENDGWLGLTSPGQNLFRSQDGGVTWTAIADLPPAVPVNSVTFSSSTNGTVVTSESTWVTSDGGDTWTELTPTPVP
jgi:hypothetical protein